MVQIGGEGNYVNPDPCSPEDAALNWQQLFEFQTVVNNFITEGGGVDAFTFMETTGGTAGFWDEKIQNPSTYDVDAHQLVLWQIEGDGTVTMFTDKGVGAGDNYTVKIDAAGAAGYLEAKIHAGTWEPTDTYDSGTHFIILAASVSDAVRFYAPYNTIKTNAGDGSPGYLVDKFADLATYDGSTHVLAEAENLGSTMRLFVAKSAIQSAAAGVALGAVRYCKIPHNSVSPSTNSSGTVTPNNCVGLVELVRNVSTGHLEPGDEFDTGDVIYPFPDPVVVASGRWKVGVLLADTADPDVLVLQPPSCRSFPEPD